MDRCIINCGTRRLSILCYFVGENHTSSFVIEQLDSYSVIFRWRLQVTAKLAMNGKHINFWWNNKSRNICFQDLVSDFVITYEPDDQSANSMFKIREVKNSFINYLPQPSVCNQTILQLLNDLPIADNKDEFVKMLTQVNLIMVAAKLPFNQMNRPFLRNVSYPLRYLLFAKS